MLGIRFHGINSGVYSILVCRLRHERERTQCEITRVACIPLAQPGGGFSGGSQTTSLYILH
jgi:hypothetical protein